MSAPTRLGVFSDVHANLHALEAVLGELAAAGVDGYVCAGDLVGYGALPGECLERVLALPTGVTVAGNHDLAVAGALSADGYPRLAVDSIAWTRARLSAAHLRALARLPRADVAAGVAVAHGSPGDPERYVRTRAAAVEALAAVVQELLVLGHTHAPMAVGERRGAVLAGRTGVVALPPGERHVLNPGAVGQSRERRPLARFLVLDLDRREATFRAVRYDTRACRAALRSAGRPPWSCHLSPTLPARLVRRAARLAT